MGRKDEVLVLLLITCILFVHDKIGLSFQDGVCEVYICEIKVLIGQNLYYYDCYNAYGVDGKIYS